MAAKKISPELLGFGGEIKTLRTAAGLNQEQLAALVNVTRSYIGQVERGVTRCRRDFAERLDEKLGTGTQLQATWDELIRGTKYPKHFVKFPKVEATAAVLRAYESHIVYGLFQTEAYATALIKRPEGVAVRMGRQQKVMSVPCPQIFVVLEEGVFYRPVGGQEVMHEQLEHLLELSHKDEICLQVIPMDVYVEEARAPFGIATQEDRSEAAYIVNAMGGETTTDENQLAGLSKSFARLQGEALNVRDTRSLMRKVLEERWT
ncbi:helix-turn-helix domain-containing protein [Actinomadura kijaniata]|uniref:helix-turn-helix domain-containing protein n=1 Tax=Actinomadura kijaniata TaxID=46161 RepID=UPI00083369FB|nr:helix-turn-helix transcriptional regulator [Actinomadura kijaniata]